MPENLTRKILEEHLVGGREEIALRVDQVLLQDATGTMAALEYLELGGGRIQVPFAIQYVDHTIHRRNLIAQGVVPLLLLGDERAVQGDTWRLPEIRARIERGDERCLVGNEGRGVRFELGLAFTKREREILLAGGVIAYVRSRRPGWFARAA